MDKLIARVDIPHDPDLDGISIREGCVLCKIQNHTSGKKYVFGIDKDHLKSFGEFLKNITWTEEN